MPDPPPEPSRPPLTFERNSPLPVPTAEGFAWHERPGALTRLGPAVGGRERRIRDRRPPRGGRGRVEVEARPRGAPLARPAHGLRRSRNGRRHVPRRAGPRAVRLLGAHAPRQTRAGRHEQPQGHRPLPPARRGAGQIAGPRVRGAAVGGAVRLPARRHRGGPRRPSPVPGPAAAEDPHLRGRRAARDAPRRVPHRRRARGHGPLPIAGGREHDPLEPGGGRNRGRPPPRVRRGGPPRRGVDPGPLDRGEEAEDSTTAVRTAPVCCARRWRTSRTRRRRC